VYAPLSRFLLRAPLLPAASLARATRALTAHPLGAAAIAIASPTLAGAPAGPARDRSITRYARRAAFRATPNGLLAGVCVGELGPKTELATGTPAPHLAPSWARVDALGRALLDDFLVRERVRLRVAPSVSMGAAQVRWIGPGEPFAKPRVAELDERLMAVLAAAADWTPWPAVRAGAAGDGAGGELSDETEDLDELLLALVDDGLLQTDLSPPLIGPPPAQYLRDRLLALGRQGDARLIAEAQSAFEAGDLALGRSSWEALPGRAARDLHAVLTLSPDRTPRLERAAVTRAARLVPLLIRLQEAMAPPAAERFADRAWSDALDASTEIFGGGRFDLAALAAGDYGVDVDGDDGGGEAAFSAAPPAALLTVLVDAIAEAARRKRPHATLDVAALEAALAGLEGTPLPATAELFLMPTRRPPGARPGTGWLLGLHAPAGASWGRFVHAVGGPLADACAEIAAAEDRRLPGEERVDVSFAPSAALADLCAHPPIRPRALALSGWSAAANDLAPGDLELEADPAEPQALALRERSRPDAPRSIVPSPLLRARSATAAPGVARLLVGWSLQRQHAPWAFSPGPLAGLAFLPRLVVDGFVIAPASWRLPAELPGAPLRPATIARWRREAAVPRLVQVGEGDELYPVDLQSAEAPGDLAGHDRVFEVWPPLDATVDRQGRRVEAIVAVVNDEPSPPGDSGARPGRVPPPRQQPPLPGWRTFKLFGASAGQDRLLTETVVPTVEAARAAGEIDAWFFLRYIDGPGERPHLRLRARGTGGNQPEAFERRLRAALPAVRAAGTATSLESGDFFPERGRFDAVDLAAVHRIFEADSETVTALLAGEPELDRIAALPALFDALARGLGLELAARHALARGRRNAADAWTQLDSDARRESDAGFRRQARPLRAALLSPPPLLTRYQARVAEVCRDLKDTAGAQLLPSLLHLSAVRLVGPDPEAERLGYTFWERTLEGLRKSK
jgi:lantibiotic biosynthesis protein